MRRVRFPMAPPDLFSDSLHDTVQDPPLVHDLGTVEGGYAELVGQDLPGNLPFLISFVNRNVEGHLDDRPGDMVRPRTGPESIEGKVPGFPHPKH